MKKQTKQVYIDLLNKALTVPEHETLRFWDIQTELEALLGKHKTQTLYTKALSNLCCKFECLNYDGDYTEAELLTQINNTLTILNTPLRQLEEQEAAITRQLELDEYHKELPLKILELLAEADSLDLDYKVVKEESNLIVLLYKEDTNYKKYGADVTISLYGEPYEYYEAVNYISTIKEELEAEQRKADLIAAAKAKLTDGEKQLLGL